MKYQVKKNPDCDCDKVDGYCSNFLCENFYPSKYQQNLDVVGKYIIVKDNTLLDFFKDNDGNIKLYNNIQDAQDDCGIYELENVLIMNIVYNHIEK